MKHTRKQISEAIRYWEKQLNRINESLDYSGMQVSDVLFLIAKDAEDWYPGDFKHMPEGLSDGIKIVYELLEKYIKNTHHDKLRDVVEKLKKIEKAANSLFQMRKKISGRVPLHANQIANDLRDIAVKLIKMNLNLKVDDNDDESGAKTNTFLGPYAR